MPMNAVSIRSSVSAAAGSPTRAHTDPRARAQREAEVAGAAGQPFDACHHRELRPRGAWRGSAKADPGEPTEGRIPPRLKCRRCGASPNEPGLYLLRAPARSVHFQEQSEAGLAVACLEAAVNSDATVGARAGRGWRG